MAFTSVAKDLNEKSIIDCMRDNRPRTKQELASETGLSFPTVSKLMDELTASGVMLALGTREGIRGGRKASLFRLNEAYAHILALFLQGESVFYEVYDAAGKRLDRGERKQARGQAPAELILETVQEVCGADTGILAAVIGVPGSVHSGKICYIDGYEGMQGRELESEIAGLTGLAVTVCNNMSAVACGLAGEKENRAAQTGRPQSEENLACVHLSETGPGCGALIGGRPVKGFCGFNGEIGFLPFYGKRTLQEIALDGFRGIKPGEYLGKIVICLSTVLNPEKIILYIEKKWQKEVLKEQILKYCKGYLPEEVIPELLLADSYREDYFRGLLSLGMEILFP